MKQPIAIGVENYASEFAIVTGCLRISKESIFTGLNNLKINSILSNNYAEYFGFIGEEVEQMLRDYGLEEKMSEVKQWYDGYRFGETEVYNPWSIINYVDITYGEIHKSQDNLWNFLFFTGYLKVVSKRFEDRRIYLTMSIPNDEVLTIYEDTIREWFDRQTKAIDFKPFYRAVLDGKTEEMEEFLSGLLEKSISYYDNREAFYHGVMVGLFGGLSGYAMKSNREYGNGRPDLVLSPYNPRKSVIIFEFKSCKKYTGMAEGCQAALDQIEEKNYAAPFLDKGYTKIMKYGICFCEKTCMVEMGS